MSQRLPLTSPLFLYAYLFIVRFYEEIAWSKRGTFAFNQILLASTTMG